LGGGVEAEEGHDDDEGLEALCDDDEEAYSDDDEHHAMRAYSHTQKQPREMESRGLAEIAMYAREECMYAREESMGVRPKSRRARGFLAPRYIHVTSKSKASLSIGRLRG
jgi:hypothetical protein